MLNFWALDVACLAFCLSKERTGIIGQLFYSLKKIYVIKEKKRKIRQRLRSLKAIWFFKKPLPLTPY